MLVDTDVIIWLFRGNKKAAARLNKCDSVELSAVSYMELVQGMRNNNEFRLLRETIYKRQWRVLPLSENISHRATILIETYALSNGLALADALIAATAIEIGQELLTANVKHYKVLPDIKLQQFRV